MAAKKKATAKKTVAKKESSNAMSKLAAKVLNKGTATDAEARRLAASVLSQDETKGPRKKKK